MGNNHLRIKEFINSSNSKNQIGVNKLYLSTIFLLGLESLKLHFLDTFNNTFALSFFYFNSVQTIGIETN